MAEDQTAFPVVMRGYDRAQVDQHLHSLEKKLGEARAQVESMDAATMQMSGQLSEAQAQVREAERPSYAGLGSRIEQLLRSAEEQSSDVVSQANAHAKDVVGRATATAEQLTSQAENEAAELLSNGRRDEGEVTQ